MAEASARVEERLSGLSRDVVAAALLNCFGMLARLREVESMVRVLQLVSVMVEVSGLMRVCALVCRGVLGGYPGTERVRAGAVVRVLQLVSVMVEVSS